MQSSNGHPIRLWMIAVVLATIAPVVLFGFWLAHIELRQANEAAAVQLRSVSRALMQAVDREFLHREGTLLTLAAAPSLKSGNLADFYNLAQAIVARMPETSGVILADRSGQQIINTRRPFGSPLPRRGDMTPVDKVFETRKPWVSDLFIGALMNIPVIGIDIPVIEGDEVKYNLALSIPLEELDRILLQQRFPEGVNAAIVDRSGTIVSHFPDTSKWLGKKLSHAISTDPGLRQEAVYLDALRSDGTPVLAAQTRSQESGWSVAISRPKSHIHAALAPNLILLFLTGALALVIGVLLASLVSRKIVTATTALAESAAKIGTTGYATPDRTGIAEIDSVSSGLSEASALLRERSLQRDSAEEHQRLLVAELDHRVKNILASVQALTRQSLAPSEARHALEGRVMALAQAHNLLANSRWRGAEFGDLIKKATDAHSSSDGRVETRGPRIVLDPRTTQGLSLVFHELVVNSAKYGSLSEAQGRLSITWSVSHDRLIIKWVEVDGPAVQPPERAGFGSRLIELSIQELGGVASKEFLPTGLRCTIDIPVDEGRYLDGWFEREEVVTASQIDQRPTVTGKRILIVEDSALVAADLASLLADAGAIVVGPFGSLREASEGYRTTTTDAALLDVNLNGEAVFPLADELMASGIKVIFLTGYGDAHIWPEHLRSVRRLLKPVREAEVLQALSEMVS